LLALINDAEIEPLWAEDETIGWIYQYFNSREERKAMRDASQAPRNSRELAVRNQFFTPRYVVEFLVDNTLGRIWYEMTRGETKLAETCRYLVRRPNEIFLFDPDSFLPDEVRAWVRQVRTGDFSDLPDDPTEDELASISFAFDGFAVAKAVGDYGDLMRWAVARVETFEQTGELPPSMLDRWLLLFAMQRSWRHLSGSGPVSPDFVDLWRRLYLGWREAIRADHTDLTQEELLRQPVFIPHRPLKDPRTIRMLDPACGSMHFGLYAFDLYAVIYEEAWRRRLIAPQDFGYRAQAVFLHESVWLDPKRKPISTYSSEVVPFDQAYVAITRQGDGGDGIRPDWPELVDAHTRWRVPMDYRVPLRDFDYHAALRDGRFSPEAGEAFVRRAGCFAFEEIPAISEDLAYANYVRQIPRLIIEHNIHGIDIDPRAVQIAGLSLWLRAQRSWQQQGVKPADRPAITKSNVVCAEPMPGDSQMLAEFAAGLQPRVLGELVKVIFEKMKLAGEAGSLLKIEEEIAQAVEDARKAAPLLDLAELPDPERFWAEAEGRLIDALREYAEQAQGDGLARRLFAADAARGFAFIDVCRRQYDCILMNPPFGEASESASSYLADRFPNWNANLLCSFIQRGWEKCSTEGSVGVIFDRTAVVKSTYENFRRNMLTADDRLIAVADLGWEVLDANVEVFTAVLSHSNAISGGVFIDLREFASDQKREKLKNRLALLYGAATDSINEVFIRNGSAFSRLPNAVIGYDFPDFLQTAFVKAPSLEEAGYRAYQGHALKADKHFRLWWEMSFWDGIGIRSRLFNGSGYSPYLTTLVDCITSPCAVEKLPKDSSTRISNADLHGTAGVCFGKRGEFLSAHVLPSGHFFTVEGQAIPIKQYRNRYQLLGFLNTPIVRLSLNKYCGQHKYSGYVNLMPYWQFVDSIEVDRVVQTAIQSSAIARRHDEVQPAFCPGVSPVTLSDYAESLRDVNQNALHAALYCESFCHERTLDRYELTSVERIEVEAFRARQPRPNSSIEDILSDEDYLWFSAHTWISLSVGNAFGRWDVRYGVGDKTPPELPDPFDPLPSCPPGMLQNAAGLPATPADVPADYPLRISWPGILVDDATNKEDIVGRVREALAVVWGEGSGQKADGSAKLADAEAPPTANRQPPTADAIEQEACQILGVATLRDYFASPNRFFDDHLKRYSKSRRQAPIYWPLSTPSGSYTLWLYYHRLTDQTLYSCVNDFVEPKLAECSRQMADLRRLGQRSAAQERELEKLVNLTRELEEFRAELLRLAPLWKPNLNDGVQITAAPLWRLFQHRAWQKRLRETWEKLEAGEYDWAHLAYSLWPARVREKCRADKSLAIAHGLEALYVEPPAGKKGKGRKKVTAEQEEMFDA
jgi:hypothetical protein